VREWLYWEVDVLFPPVFNCYGIQLGKQNLLPISVEPVIADYHRRRAEAALSIFDSHLAHASYLCSNEPTIADIACRGDVAFAEISAIDVGQWRNVSSWAARVAALPGFKPPLALLPMADAELS
jgi:glutathione S-transferase